jgi:PAS domain S-box-containing protein
MTREGELQVRIDRDLLGSDGQFVMATITDISSSPEASGPRTAEVGRDAAHFPALFKATTIGVVEVSPDARILRANDAFCRMIGYSSAELGGMAAADLLFPADCNRVLTQYSAVATGRVASYEAERRYRRKDGSALWARVSVVAQEAAPSRATVVVIDLTERKQMEEQFWHAQRVEVLGVLASCTAHDFNNLLTVINGCAELLQAELPEAAPARELVRGIARACRRATGLAAELLAFGRKATVEPRILDLNEAVVRSVQFLRPLLGGHITLATDLASNLSRVSVDPMQVEQIVLNLAVNAKDAMPHGGTLTIETRGLRLQEKDRIEYPDLPPGEYVLLSVSDTGVGMTDEVKARAFELFFTTKGAGKGTGLGLAAVRGAIEQCGGRVDVVSEVGVGTSIRMLLPAVPARSA